MLRRSRYSLVEALIVEGVLEDRIAQVTTQMRALLDRDPATLNPREQRDYARANAIIQFADMIQSPENQSVKNVGYLNWGIGKIRECADAEINTIAEEVMVVIRGHATYKNTGMLSQNIDDYTTLGAAREAVDAAELSRRSKGLESEMRKGGAETLSAAIKMSDVLYTDAPLGTDEAGNLNFGDAKKIIIATKTRFASQTIGNPRTYGINSVGGPVRWCTSAGTSGNMYCSYTVRSGVFLIYVIDLTKPDNDPYQKVAFVYTPTDKSPGVATGTASGLVNFGGKQFQFQTFNNLDASGAEVTKRTEASLGSSFFSFVEDTIEDYIVSQGGVPHLAKKSIELQSGNVSPDFIKGVASEDLPAAYGVEALYDTMGASYGDKKSVPPALNKFLNRDVIDRKAAIRIVNMLLQTSHSEKISDIAMHFLTNVEDLSAVADAIAAAATNAGDPNEVKKCLKYLEVISERSDINEDDKEKIDSLLSKVDLLMAQAIGRLPPMSMLNYAKEIEQSKYTQLIVQTFGPGAKAFLDSKMSATGDGEEVGTLTVKELEGLLTILGAIKRSPGMKVNRQTAIRLVPVNTAIARAVTGSIRKLISRNSFGGAKRLADLADTSDIANVPENRKYAEKLNGLIGLSRDLVSRNVLLKNSDDEQMVIDIMQQPDMTRYLDAFTRSGGLLTLPIISAAFERAKSEGVAKIEEWVIDAATSDAGMMVLEGDEEIIEMFREALSLVPPDSIAHTAVEALGFDFGTPLAESYRRVRRSGRITERKRYSLIKALLG